MPAPALRWTTIGKLAPSSLTDARLQCHYAAQVVSSAGVTFLAPQPDDSHTNMGWRDDLGALEGRSVNPGQPLRAAMRFTDLTLLLLDDAGKISAEFPLDGRTLDEAYQSLGAAMEALIGRPLAMALRRPAYEMPAHPTASGRFSVADSEAFGELSRWYSNANALLQQLQAGTPNASEVRCWPHHFDIAALLELDKGEAVQKPRTIGVGLAPGDNSYDEPYFYVTPYPYPEQPVLTELEGGGAWHTAGWFGCVLTGSSLAAAPGAAEQRRQVEAFVESSISACMRMLES